MYLENKQHKTTIKTLGKQEGPLKPNEILKVFLCWQRGQQNTEGDRQITLEREFYSFGATTD